MTAADKLEQTKLQERAHKEAAKAERDKAKEDKEEARNPRGGKGGGAERLQARRRGRCARADEGGAWGCVHARSQQQSASVASHPRRKLVRLPS